MGELVGVAIQGVTGRALSAIIGIAASMLFLWIYEDGTIEAILADTIIKSCSSGASIVRDGRTGKARYISYTGFAMEIDSGVKPENVC